MTLWGSITTQQLTESIDSDVQIFCKLDAPLHFSGKRPTKKLFFGRAIKLFFLLLMMDNFDLCVSKLTFYWDVSDTLLPIVKINEVILVSKHGVTIFPGGLFFVFATLRIP